MDFLANSTQQAKQLTQMTSKALAVGDAATAEALIKQITAVVEQERKVLVSKAQRSAIVSALKEPGYEGREGMETVAPHDGKVILRRAANTEMGAKVGDIHGGGRVNSGRSSLARQNTASGCIASHGAKTAQTINAKTIDSPRTASRPSRSLRSTATSSRCLTSYIPSAPITIRGGGHR
jgi:hypothetical protein